MAPHSSTLAWKIPWMEEPGRLQSMGSRKVGHGWLTSLSLFTFMHWRRQWHPTPVFLPGESQGRGSLVGCRLWGCTESDTTEVTQQQQQHTSTYDTRPHLSIFVLFFEFLFIFGCAGSLALCGLSDSCSEQGLLSSCSTWASPCDGFSLCRAWALGPVGFSSCSSWALEHRLNVVVPGLSCAMACGIFLDQRLNQCL